MEAHLFRFVELTPIYFTDWITSAAEVFLGHDKVRAIVRRGVRRLLRLLSIFSLHGVSGSDCQKGWSSRAFIPAFLLVRRECVIRTGILTME
jgi:hypothetical protein